MPTAWRSLAIVWWTLAVLVVGSVPASAQCSDWLREQALPKLGCSPFAIQEICAGRQPVPRGPDCNTPIQPRIDTTGTPYQQFRSLVTASGIDLSLHPTYTEQYFDQRTRLFCNLLRTGELVKVSAEVSFPPVIVWTETKQDRSRLEVVIMRVAANTYCPDQIPLERQWERTNVR